MPNYVNMPAHEAEDRNKDFWNEVTPVHYKAYEIDKLRSGISLIDDIQKREFYPIKGKEILHLQCHIGTDTLSLEMDGAKVTGVDFSEKSITIAKKLRDELSLKSEFILSNIFDLEDKLKRKFDIVYTSKGVLTWVKDIKKWAKIISSFIKPGGFYYMMEIHPVKCMFDDTIENDLQVKYSYFHRNEPFIWDDKCPDYADRSYVPKNPTYEWNWSLSDIVNALISNGLKLEFLNEYDKLFYNGLPGMKSDKKGWWDLERYRGLVPYTFTLKSVFAGS
jgi:2-polyprenyl-3-methyl-5-hydroxy-6-metoxy-1,4-benzoquinol methylase